MRFDREGRRTAAQFFNGLAVAVIGIGALTPIVTGDRSWAVLSALILGVGIHFIAVGITKR